MPNNQTTEAPGLIIMSGSTGRRSGDADLDQEAEGLVAVETNLDPTSLALLKRALESTVISASSKRGEDENA